MQVTDCGQDVERRAEVRMRGRRSFLGETESAEVNGQRTKSGVHQCMRLLLPTALFEAASVSEYDATITRSV